ncbi:MAG: hypothetical protein ACREFD_06860 [Stellaceae bacterium]
MNRTIFATVAASMLMAAAPAFAAGMSNGTMNKGAMNDSSMNHGSMNCQDEMNKAQPMMNSMTDHAKKEEAMKQMDMAKKDMAKKDMAGCMMHMNKAMGMMK